MLVLCNSERMWLQRFEKVIQTEKSYLKEKFNYDPAIEIVRCVTQSGEVTICCHGYGSNKSIAHSIRRYAPITGYLVSFNFPDYDCHQRKCCASDLTFGSINEVLPLLYIIKRLVDSGLKKISVYGFSAGGGAIINMLRSLNSKQWNSDLKRLGIGEPEKEKMIRALERGVVLLDCPLKSIQEIIDFRGHSQELQIISDQFKKNNTQPIDSVLKLLDMKLHIVLHFQDNDEVLSNRDDDLFIQRLKHANKRGIISEAMHAAYSKKYPDQTFDVQYDQRADDVLVRVQKEVVPSTVEDDNQISLRKARAIDNALLVGDSVWVPFDGKIGRIEVLKAKQLIAGRIAQIEASVVYDEFKEKEGSIVYGVIHKCERNGVVVKIGDHLAFLPKSLTIPGSRCIVGYSIRALLKEVLPEPRNDNQLILDRASAEFVEGLFAAEIPEVFEKLVEIKKAVRASGYKTKIALVSNDSNIDPVGTCVGVGGARIKPILKELGGEKIDIIAWIDDPEIFVRAALKPAKIDKVEIEGDSVANVWLDKDQRSLAIGRSGKNISLASQLTGFDINLVQQEGDDSPEAV